MTPEQQAAERAERAVDEKLSMLLLRYFYAVTEQYRRKPKYDSGARELTAAVETAAHAIEDYVADIRHVPAAPPVPTPWRCAGCHAVRGVQLAYCDGVYVEQAHGRVWAPWLPWGSGTAGT